MSGAGAPQISVAAEGMTLRIVAAQWHTTVMDGLVAGAVRAAEAAGVTYTVTRVPGAFELPVVAEAMARKGGIHAIACLGVVIKGSTPHFEYVCDAVTRGLSDVALKYALPVGFGVLTCDDESQALARAGLPGSTEDKGAEAVEAALATALVLKGI